MRRPRTPRLLRGLAAAAAVAVASSTGLVLVGGSASAVPTATTVQFRCSLAAFASSFEADGLQSIPVTVDAPAAVEAGDDIVVSYALTGATPTNSPFSFDDVVTRARPSLNARPTVGGTPVVVGEGTAATSAATDLAPYAQLPAPTPVDVRIPTDSLGSADLVSLRVDALRIDLVSGSGGIGGAVMTCTPEPEQAEFASVVVTPGVPIPSGAVGGLALAALVGLLGLGALLVQLRGRRT